MPLIKDCDFYDQKSPEPRVKNVVNTGERVVKPVWDYGKRVNHQNFSKNLKYPHAKRTFNPSAVLTRAGLVNTDRSNVSTARSISTVRPVSTARPLASKIAQSNSVIRPYHPRLDIVRPKASNSPIKRSYFTQPVYRPKDLKPDVKTFGVKNMTTVGTRAVVSKGKVENVLKKAKWVWRPKMNYQDHVYKYNGSYMLKKFEYGNPEILLQDHAVVDSGCSSHMTGNKAYLSDYEDLNGGFVAFGSDPKGGKITGKGKIKTANLDFDDVYFVDELKFNLFSVSQMCDKKNSVLFTESECLILSPSFKLLDESQVVLRAPRKDGVYSLDLKNIVPSGGITCLYANATADESKLWHRRLGHVNFKNINKLVKGHLVRGLPSKVFVNDHTCVACKKGKQHKASCKAKLDRIIRKPLELLHMDLFGPVSIESINKKRYCLVVTDDFSRFSWVFFLATKDETSEILCNLIIGLEKQLNHNVKIIRCDNGTEFKNYVMNEFCAKKGIKREFSVARTPQQNGVAERKNRTLIEAARTMLADSLLPIPFWAEAVNTACYVLNRVLVTKPQNKTPYELLIGKSPSISFMRPFGCPLTILNTLDSLGKFDGKSDEGYLLGYSTSSKAFRVYNKRTKRVEENLHINFLEDQPNVAGTGPNWMFDLDFLTNSMNYIPVSVENQVIVDAGTQDSYVAGSSGKDKGPTQEYILLPLQPHRTRIPVKDVVQDAQEQPSENASPDKGIQVSEDVFDKEGQHQMPEDEQVWQDELEMMVTQELVANAMNDESRQAFEEEKRRIASQKKAAQATSTNQLSTDRPFVSTDRSFVSTDRSNTPNVSAASTSTGANADESSFVYLGGKIPIDASTLPNADLPIDPNMPDLEDASDTLPNDGIFNGAYDDDEDVGAVADFNNMDNTIAVSPIPTLRIHKDHPKGQILGDPTSAVQTRGKIQKASSAQQALLCGFLRRWIALMSGLAVEGGDLRWVSGCLWSSERPCGSTRCGMDVMRSEVRTGEGRDIDLRRTGETSEIERGDERAGRAEIVIRELTSKRDFLWADFGESWVCDVIRLVEYMVLVLNTVAWIVLGVDLDLPSNEPYLATSLQDFWGRRWNLTVTSILRHTIFKPIINIFSSKEWTSFSAIMASFLVSGLMHELFFYYVTRVNPTWENASYFMLQGIYVVVELLAKRALARTFSSGAVVVARLFTVGFVVVTSFWLFFPSLIRSNANVKAIEEFKLLVHFAKTIAVCNGSIAAECKVFVKEEEELIMIQKNMGGFLRLLMACMYFLDFKRGSRSSRI
ncbi:putative ribonuclease H-like domain-containing protein [Tanacetum coccineum]